VDKAERHFGEKNFPRGTAKARDSNNAHPGKTLTYPAQTWGRWKRHFCAEK
jgi:hypothetical protein